MKKKSLTVEEKKSWVGFSFIIIWLIGFLGLYIYPLIMSLVYSFVDLTKGKFVGLYYYDFALFQNQNFFEDLVTSLKAVIYDMPGITIFSLVIALLLSQKFKGQGFFKVIFFLPIIMSSGQLMSFLNADSLSTIMKSGERSGNTFQLYVLQETLANMGLGDDITEIIFTFINDIFGLVLKSGVQILLFIAGLNSISPAVYEAASIDGCTAWEKFWKITFPLITPIMLVNIIYTLTESFTTSNAIINSIVREAQATNYSYSTAMSWMYMVVVLSIIGIVFLIFNSRTTYIEK